MSSRAPVHVSVEFISARSGSKPAICIDNPIELTKSIGMACGKSSNVIYPTDFASLKLGLVNIIEDSEYDLHFHNDVENTYTFDEKQFSHGAIYCRKNKRKEREDKNKKVTAGKLVPLQNSVQFEKHVKEVADVVYKRLGKNQKQP